MTVYERAELMENGIGLPVTPTPSPSILLAPKGLTLLDQPYT